jgi:hypothetical protein
MAMRSILFGRGRRHHQQTVIFEPLPRNLGLKGATVRAVYVCSGEDPSGPPLELLHFVEPAGKTRAPYAGLTNPGIAEVAFWVKDIEKRCADLRARVGGIVFRASAF